jgi:hypothetical protein
MKKFGLLILLALMISIGGVYATWVYSQSDDVADITNARAITMTEATFEGNYGTFSTDASALSLKVDPKEGTTHTTSLKIEGYIVIKFTPATHAPEDVKKYGVATTYQFNVSNPNWKYSGQYIISVDSSVKNVTWTLQADGTLTYTVTAEELASILTLTEFTLDTKVDYDAYDAVLTNGQITLTISDGKTSSSN